MDLIEGFNILLKKYSMKKLGELLNLSTGTIKRWLELKNIPKNYEFDILKLLDVKIDYSSYSTKDKDQFFTPIETAKYCFDTFKMIINKYGDNYEDYIYIEPSAGDGSFLKVLPENTKSLRSDKAGDSLTFLAILSDILNSLSK